MTQIESPDSRDMQYLKSFKLYELWHKSSRTFSRIFWIRTGKAVSDHLHLKKQNRERFKPREESLIRRGEWWTWLHRRRTRLNKGVSRVHHRMRWFRKMGMGKFNETKEGGHDQDSRLYPFTVARLGLTLYPHVRLACVTPSERSQL